MEPVEPRMAILLVSEDWLGVVDIGAKIVRKVDAADCKIADSKFKIAWEGKAGIKTEVTQCKRSSMKKLRASVSPWSQHSSAFLSP
jgi:hypothetical protein